MEENPELSFVLKEIKEVLLKNDETSKSLKQSNRDLKGSKERCSEVLKDVYKLAVKKLEEGFEETKSQLEQAHEKMRERLEEKEKIVQRCNSVLMSEMMKLLGSKCDERFLLKCQDVLACVTEAVEITGAAHNITFNFIPNPKLRKTKLGFIQLCENLPSDFTLSRLTPMSCIAIGKQVCFSLESRLAFLCVVTDFCCGCAGTSAIADPYLRDTNPRSLQALFDKLGGEWDYVFQAVLSLPKSKWLQECKIQTVHNIFTRWAERIDSSLVSRLLSKASDTCFKMYGLESVKEGKPCNKYTAEKLFVNMEHGEAPALLNIKLEIKRLCVGSLQLKAGKDQLLHLYLGEEIVLGIQPAGKQEIGISLRKEHLDGVVVCFGDGESFSDVRDVLFLYPNSSGCSVITEALDQVADGCPPLLVSAQGEDRRVVAHCKRKVKEEMVDNVMSLLRRLGGNKVLEVDLEFSEALLAKTEKASRLFSRDAKENRKRARDQESFISSRDKNSKFFKQGTVQRKQDGNGVERKPLQTVRLSCFKCGYQTGDTSQLNVHILTHFTKELNKRLQRFNCPLCTYKNMDRKDLAYHYAFTHGKIFDFVTKEQLEGTVKIDTRKTELDDVTKDLLKWKSSTEVKEVFQDNCGGEDIKDWGKTDVALTRSYSTDSDTSDESFSSLPEIDRAKSFGSNCSDDFSSNLSKPVGQSKVKIDRSAKSPERLDIFELFPSLTKQHDKSDDRMFLSENKISQSMELMTDAENLNCFHTRSPSRSGSCSPGSAPQSRSPSRSGSHSPGSVHQSRSPSRSGSRSPGSVHQSRSPSMSRSHSPGSAPQSRSRSHSPGSELQSRSRFCSPLSARQSRSSSRSRSHSPGSAPQSRSRSRSPGSELQSRLPFHSPGSARQSRSSSRSRSRSPGSAPQSRSQSRSPGSELQSRSRFRSPLSARQSRSSSRSRSHNPGSASQSRSRSCSPGSAPQSISPSRSGSRSPASSPQSRSPFRSGSLSPGSVPQSRSPSRSPSRFDTILRSTSPVGAAQTRLPYLSRSHRTTELPRMVSSCQCDDCRFTNPNHWEAMKAKGVLNHNCHVCQRQREKLEQIKTAVASMRQELLDCFCEDCVNFTNFTEFHSDIACMCHPCRTNRHIKAVEAGNEMPRSITVEAGNEMPRSITVFCQSPTFPKLVFMKDANEPNEKYFNLSCSLIRIGSYPVRPQDKLVVLHKNCLEMRVFDAFQVAAVPVRIDVTEIQSALVSFNDALPLLVLYLNPVSCAVITKNLRMDHEILKFEGNESVFCIDSVSGNETQKRMIIFLEKISENAEKALRNFFNEDLTELSEIGAQEILLKSGHVITKEDNNIQRPVLSDETPVKDIEQPSPRLTKKGIFCRSFAKEVKENSNVDASLSVTTKLVTTSGLQNIPKLNHGDFTKDDQNPGIMKRIESPSNLFSTGCNCDDCRFTNPNHWETLKAKGILNHNCHVCQRQREKIEQIKSKGLEVEKVIEDTEGDEEVNKNKVVPWKLVRVQEYEGYNYWSEPWIDDLLRGIRDGEVSIVSAAAMTGTSYGIVYNKYVKMFGKIKQRN